jgi:hypothetical protein
MTTEEQEYNDFMTEVSKESKKLWNNYNKLSEDNKRKFLLYIEPLVRAGGTQGFINQMNLLFNTGIKK